MKNLLALIVVLTMTIALSSCASMGIFSGMDEWKERQKWMEQKLIYSETEMIAKPEVLAPIKSIALLNIPNPHYYLPYRLEVGSTIVGKDTIKYKGFNFSAITQQHLIEYLEANGYRVILLSVKRDRQYELLDDYSQLNIDDVDAFLDLAPVQIGFTINPWGWKGIHGSELRPHMSVVVRLVSADSKKILYAESVQYGYNKNPFFDSTMIDSPPDDSFDDADTLISQNEKAIEQLVRGIDAISHAIAERLER
ncbi:hypothetical protein ACFL3P_06085 [Pseudomonadota bacterium]